MNNGLAPHNPLHYSLTQRFWHICIMRCASFFIAWMHQLLFICLLYASLKPTTRNVARDSLFCHIVNLCFISFNLAHCQHSRRVSFSFRFFLLLLFRFHPQISCEFALSFAPSANVHEWCVARDPFASFMIKSQQTRTKADVLDIYSKCVCKSSNL